MYDGGEEEVEVEVKEDTEPEAQVQAEHDPDAWVLDEAWQPDEDLEVWSRWNHQEYTKAKWQDRLQTVKSEPGEEQPTPADSVVQDAPPTWAKARSVHLQNNVLRDGHRGSYDIDSAGNTIFKASAEFGGQAYAAGLGRERGRTRGKGSQAWQRAKSAAKSNEAKGKNKGKSNKGYGKGNKGGSKSDNNVAQALQTMNIMATSTEKWVSLLGNSVKAEKEAEEETKRVKLEWSDPASSSSSSSWRWR